MEGIVNSDVFVELDSLGWVTLVPSSRGLQTLAGLISEVNTASSRPQLLYLPQLHAPPPNENGL